MTSRVPGHGLQYEGRPVLLDDCCGTTGRRNYYDGHGHGECLCGAMSPHETTNTARQRWHRQHKAEIQTERTRPRVGSPQEKAEAALADTGAIREWPPVVGRP